MLREFGQDGIFLWRQVNLVAFSCDRAAEQVDRYAARLDRLLFGNGIEVEQIGNVPLQFARFRFDRGYEFLVARAVAALLARSPDERVEARVEVGADRRQQD